MSTGEDRSDLLDLATVRMLEIAAENHNSALLLARLYPESWGYAITLENRLQSCLDRLAAHYRAVGRGEQS